MNQHVKSSPNQFVASSFCFAVETFPFEFLICSRIQSSCVFMQSRRLFVREINAKKFDVSSPRFLYSSSSARELSIISLVHRGGWTNLLFSSMFLFANACFCFDSLSFLLQFDNLITTQETHNFIHSIQISIVDCT